MASAAASASSFDSQRLNPAYSPIASSARKYRLLNPFWARKIGSNCSVSCSSFGRAVGSALNLVTRAYIGHPPPHAGGAPPARGVSALRRVSSRHAAAPSGTIHPCPPTTAPPGSTSCADFLRGLAAEAVLDEEDRLLVADALDADQTLDAAELPGGSRRSVQGGRSGQPHGYGETQR